MAKKSKTKSGLDFSALTTEFVEVCGELKAMFPLCWKTFNAAREALRDNLESWLFLPNSIGLKIVMDAKTAYLAQWEKYVDRLRDDPGSVLDPHLAAQQFWAARGGFDPEQAAVYAPSLNALAAWRPAQGVYHFHSSLERELRTSDVSGKVPVGVLNLLPEWCPFVVFREPIKAYGIDCRGFFFRNSTAVYDAQRGQERTLEFVFWYGSFREHSSIPLRHATLEECVADWERDIRTTFENEPEYAEFMESTNLQDRDFDINEMLTTQIRAVRQALPLVLYLCSANAEMRNDRTGKEWRGSFPKVARNKKGEPVFLQPAEPEQIQVGYRIGAKLEAARERERKEYAESGRRVTPHLRRAHFHSYWTGPRDGERKILIKWVAPILVGAAEDGVMPTFREVK